MVDKCTIFCVVDYLPRIREKLEFSLQKVHGSEQETLKFICYKQNTAEYLSLGPVLDLRFQKVTV